MGRFWCPVDNTRRKLPTKNYYRGNKTRFIDNILKFERDPMFQFRENRARPPELENRENGSALPPGCPTSGITGPFPFYIH